MYHKSKLDLEIENIPPLRTRKLGLLWAKVDLLIFFFFVIISLCFLIFFYI